MNDSAAVARWRTGAVFVLGGALNTGLSYALYLLLHRFLPFQVAYAMAYVTGIVVAYVYNARVVFKVPLSWRGLLAYPLVYVVQYIAAAVLLQWLVAGWTVSEVLAPLLVSAVMLPLTFVMSRWLLQGARPSSH
jgi:putative flippase GtrA